MWPPVPVGVGLEVEGSESAGLGVVADLIFVQIPPQQSKEHFAASHWTTHTPPIQDCLYSFTLDEQVMLHFPPGHPCPLCAVHRITDHLLPGRLLAARGIPGTSHDVAPPPQQFWKH